ncbi:MAG: four helix bundle protein [Bacteroidia bacterium]
MTKTSNPIVDKTFEFAGNILDLNSRLMEQKQYVLAKQVARSGTSIGANVRESQRAVSKADFINKLGIALKEADETQYWLELIEKKIFKIDSKLKIELNEIISLLVAIINSSKKNLKQPF